jgi:soluble lytic murein transglycosylase-like protein
MEPQTCQVSSSSRKVRAFGQALRAAACLSTAALLSACAGHSPPMTATQEAATYIARAKPSYTPPGPPNDPWGPYIAEASNRYDVPERWIREVMHTESGGHEFNASGALITSPVGAMGLMQLMPQTYDEVRARYNLGDDAFDPHNNILAGTAYLREMYDAFGSPGFLAAYNGGPARLDDYLTRNRPLPAETRRYVALIAPYIQGIWPNSRSPAEQYAVNQLPIYIPAGPRYVVHHAPVLLARNTRRGHEQAVRYAAGDRRHHARGAAPVELAEAPEPRTMRVSYVMPNGHRGFYAIESVASSSHHGASSHKSTRTTIVHTAVAHTPKAKPHSAATRHLKT